MSPPLIRASLIHRTRFRVSIIRRLGFSLRSRPREKWRDGLTNDGGTLKGHHEPPVHPDTVPDRPPTSFPFTSFTPEPPFDPPPPPSLRFEEIKDGFKPWLTPYLSPKSVSFILKENRMTISTNFLSQG